MPVKPYCLVLFGVLLVIVTGACTPGGTPMPATFTIAPPEDTIPPATSNGDTPTSTPRTMAVPSLTMTGSSSGTLMTQYL